MRASPSAGRERAAVRRFSSEFTRYPAIWPVIQYVVSTASISTSSTGTSAINR